MTREELKGMTYSDILEYISDFESRMCENCIYLDKWEFCSNETSICNHLPISMSKDDTCNKFERKNND